MLEVFSAEVRPSNPAQLFKRMERIDQHLFGGIRDRPLKVAQPLRPFAYFLDDVETSFYLEDRSDQINFGHRMIGFVHLCARLSIAPTTRLFRLPSVQHSVGHQQRLHLLGRLPTPSEGTEDQDRRTRSVRSIRR